MANRAHIGKNRRSIFEPVQRIRWLPAGSLLIGLLLLTILFPEARVLDPNSSSPWPQPDWLLHYYLLPFWLFPGKLRILGAFIMPLALGIFLIFSPRLSPKRKQRIFFIAMVLIGSLSVLWMFGQVSAMGVQVSLQGCPVCHQERIIGGAPASLSELEIRDPDWVIRHLRDPLNSIFVPYPIP